MSATTSSAGSTTGSSSPCQRRIKDDVAQLWLITGDDRYANAATVLLDRFMEEYPAMDGNDLTYDGTDWGVYVKMLPTMWEGTALSNLIDGVEILLAHA